MGRRVEGGQAVNGVWWKEGKKARKEIESDDLKCEETVGSSGLWCVSSVVACFVWIWKSTVPFKSWS